MFLVFEDQSVRKDFGGSAFLELQYCRKKKDARIEEIVSANIIKHWDNDSLYVYWNDIDDFCNQYVDVFDGGIYNNLQTGPLDEYGINYYQHKDIEGIIEKVKRSHPLGYQILLNWLEKAKEFNGFYILGI